MFDEVPTSLIGVAWRAGKLGWKKRSILKRWWAGLRMGAEPIRISCAQLIRVQRGSRFFLVPNSRISRQMQPPGGVVQAYSDGQAFGVQRSIGDDNPGNATISDPALHA